MKKTLNNILIFFRCFGKFLIHGRADTIGIIKNIAVVQLAQLGDIVCTTPMFRAVKNKYPDSRITVVGSAINKEVLAHNKDVNHYIQFNGDIESAAAMIRGTSIDVGFITTPSFAAIGMLILGGAKTIVAPIVVEGYCPQQTILYRLLSLAVRRIPYRYGQYVPGLYLKLLEPAEVYSNDVSKHLGFSEEGKKHVDEFLDNVGINKNDFLIGISPSTGNKIKNWGSKKFAKLAELLIRQEKVKIIILGGARDREEVQAMTLSIENHDRIISGLEKFNIDSLKAIISRLNMLIAVDTGLIYIAEAFEVPTVDIVGAVDDREQPPKGSKHRIVMSPTRGPAAIHILNARHYDLQEARRQIDSISVDMVAKETIDLIANIKNNS